MARRHASNAALSRSEKSARKSPVKRIRLLEAFLAGRAGFHPRVRVPVAGFDQPGEFRHVQPTVARGVELDRLGGEQQQRWRLGVALLQGGAQVVQRLAQAAAGVLLRSLGPQQLRQLFTRVRLVRLDCQVGQQSPHFIGL